MNSTVTLTPAALPAFLLNVAVVRPVFLWGPPGIGKSSLVRASAAEVGLPCVSLLGSQLAPEDLIGVPQIVDGKSVFCPPRMIAREEPYCLFLDELNASSPEVMKAFYSLILEKRIGEYQLPKGSVVVGAGNRTQDQTVVRPIAIGPDQPAHPRPPPIVAPRLACLGLRIADPPLGRRVHRSPP